MALREIDRRTGLYTLGYLVAYGARAISKAREGRYPVSLLTVELDNPLDQDSEIPGPTLRYIGERIRQNAGEDSIIAKTGEKEVAVLLLGADLEQATRIARYIRDSFGTASSGPDAGGAVAVSVGVASLDGKVTEFGELMRASRNALNHPKYPQIESIANGSG